MVYVHALMEEFERLDRAGLPRPPRRRPRSRAEAEEMAESEWAMQEHRYQAENRRAALAEAKRIFHACGAGTDAYEEAGIEIKAAHIGIGCDPVPGFDSGYNSALIRAAECAAAAYTAGDDTWNALMAMWYPFGNVISLNAVRYYDR